MSTIRLLPQISGRLFLLVIAMTVFSDSAFAQSIVGRNTNAVGKTPDGFYRGIPHYQDNEAHCDKNPLQKGNVICMANGYAGADDKIGDAWPRIFETQDNTRTWQSRFATGSAADVATSLGLGFGADPIMVCWPGGCGGFFIASNRVVGGGTGGGVYMQLLPEFNIEVGFRHFSEAGPRTVQLGTGDNFLDKIDAIFLPDTDNPGTIDVTMTVEKGNGVTETITRSWLKGRLLVVYASINSSQQNVRIFSTYSDDYGLNWSPPKQVANTTGVDTGVAVAGIDDTILYAYRQFQDDSGGDLNAIFAAVSTNRGRTVRKPFAVIENLCAFDQPTLPNEDEIGIVTSRTNNFVDLSNDGSNFVMVLAERQRDPAGGCLTEPFDYPSGSRVLVTTAGSNGKNWSTPIEIAPRDATDPGHPFPQGGHSFQFMPAVDCVLGVCQAIWYDSINDSNRNIGYLESQGWDDAVDAFVNFPLFGDFIYQLNSNGNLVQFRRTADVYTRQFQINNGITFQDPAPLRVSRYQLVALSPGVVVEAEQNSFNLKQYKGNTASFMGDYIGLAGEKVRRIANPNDPTAPPVYEPNYGSDPNNPLLRPSWFAYWTDTRNARGTLYAQDITDPLPFEKTPTTGAFANLQDALPKPDGDQKLLSDMPKLGAEGVEDSNPGVLDCSPPMDPPDEPGDMLFASANQNRIKDADIYGALIEVPATAWVLNVSKGLGDIQRAYVITARNEDKQFGTTFRFRIMNQPVGAPDDARASWLQLPFQDFDATDIPLLDIDEDVGPQSSVTVALFVVSALPVNPVTLNIYEVNGPVETLVETLEVNGSLEAGDLVHPVGAPDNVNNAEIHNPVVFAPSDFLDIDYSNPDVWNPDVWNPDVWNPDVWNPDVWNPDVWNPDVWNPDVWNPDVWNPDVWNPDVWNISLTDADALDNPEIPSPDVTGLDLGAESIVAKFDVQFGVENQGNTTTPYTADFAGNSSLVRQLLSNGDIKAQIIVWTDAERDSYQACGADIIAGDISAGENRILAAVNDADLLTLKIPDIMNNRFGLVTFYSEPGDKVRITIRFVGPEDTIRSIAPELAKEKSISYVVSSQAANTGDDALNPGAEQAIEDLIPPTLIVNSPLPVLLGATIENGQVGAILPADLVTATKAGELDPAVICSPFDLGGFAALGLGSAEFTCTATSANMATGTIMFTVIVQDQDPPVLSPMPADITVERETLSGAVVNYTIPTATDDIDSDVTVTCSIPPGGVAPFVPPASTTTEITCTATDDGGNTDSDSFFVTVEDTTPPVLMIPASASGEATNVNGTNVTFDPIPSATDIGTVAVNCTADSGDLFPIGTTTVTCTATDDVNNSAVDSFDVTVTDNVIIGTGLSTNKKSVKAGSVAAFSWAWEDSSGNPIDVGEGNQDIEAVSGNCSNPQGPDVLNEDPGSSDIRRSSSSGWQFNWQTVDDIGNRIDSGIYCVTVILMTTSPPQMQSTEIRVTP